MKNLSVFNRSLLVVFFSLPLLVTSCSSDDTDASISSTDVDNVSAINLNALTEAIDSVPLDTLSSAETEGMIFMREEEKLAHDVYVFLYGRWHANVFDNISVSEQTHTDAMLFLLDRYAVADPVGDNAEGVFVDATLQGLYDTLVAQGDASLIDALIVGAEIEEIDLVDIQNLVDALEGNDDMALVYQSLMEGSRNHLRAFVRNLEQQGVVYQPQYLSPDVYDTVVF